MRNDGLDKAQTEMSALSSPFVLTGWRWDFQYYKAKQFVHVEIHKQSRSARRNTKCLT